MSDATMGANVVMIRSEEIRLVRGRMPQQVRTELLNAVKLGHLGRLPKGNLMPEVFFHPDHRTRAIEQQQAEAIAAAARLARVMA